MKNCLNACAIVAPAHAAAPIESAYFNMDESEKRLSQTCYHQLIKIIVDKLDTPAFDALRKWGNFGML